MKLPEYSIIKEVSYQPPGSNVDPVGFPGGTLIMPFWSRHNLPTHIRDKFEEHIKYLPEKEKYVMCLIGRTWIPVLTSNIRRN